MSSSAMAMTAWLVVTEHTWNPVSRCQIPGIIPKRRVERCKHALTCDSQAVRYAAFQIARVWFCRMWTIAKVGLAWAPTLLPVWRHVADLILVPSTGSRARNVTGGRKLARHDFCRQCSLTSHGWPGLLRNRAERARQEA
jgi:hypothetical protein